MDFGRAFSFVFQDPDWAKKVLLAALVSIIPIVGQLFLIGWSLEVARRVIAGESIPLPELDFSRNLERGFKGFIVSLVYALPLIAVSIVYALVVAFAGSDSNNNLNALGIVTTGCFTIVSIAYGLLLAFLLPAALGRLTATGLTGAALQLGEVWALVRANPGAYLLVVVGVIVTGFIGSLGSIACGIGVFFTLAYAAAVNGHLYGQAYRAARLPAQYPAPGAD